MVMTTTIGKSQGRRGVCIRYVVVAVPCAVHPLLCSVQMPVFRSKCDQCALQSSVRNFVLGRLSPSQSWTTRWRWCWWWGACWSSSRWHASLKQAVSQSHKGPRAGQAGERQQAWVAKWDSQGRAVFCWNHPTWTIFTGNISWRCWPAERLNSLLSCAASQRPRIAGALVGHFENSLAGRRLHFYLFYIAPSPKRGTDKFNENEGPFKALPHCVCNQCGRSLCGQGRLLLIWELYVQTMWNFYVDGHLPKASFSWTNTSSPP